jgi:radical SAM protein with 4Fe4S-binding SPASM domain
MNLRQRLVNLQIGLREHSTISPRYLGSMLKRRVRCGLRLDYHWPGGWSPRPDLWVCAIPTYRCNLACEMCCQRNEGGEARGAPQEQELEPEQWKKIIDRIARFAPGILWMGGEVLIYPRMVELCAYAKSQGLKVLLITNGYLLADVARQLVDVGVDAITVSIDGLQECHNDLRGNSQSFQRAVQGVEAVLAARRARRAKLPILALNHTLTRQNYRQVADFVALARALGVDIIHFIGLMYLSPQTVQRHKDVMQREFGVAVPDMEVLDNSHYAAGINAAWLQAQLDALRASSRGAPALRFCAEGMGDYVEEHYGPDENLPLPNQRCTSLWRKMAIQPNGDVTVCYNLPELPVGHALHDELDEVWNSEKFRQFRQRIKRQFLPACIRCAWLDYL